MSNMNQFIWDNLGESDQAYLERMACEWARANYMELGMERYGAHAAELLADGFENELTLDEVMR